MSDTREIGRAVIVGVAAREHGDNATFIIDPAKYIATHACQLHAELEEASGAMSGSATNAAFTRSTCGTQGIQFLPVADRRLTVKLLEAPSPFVGMPLIKCLAGGGGKEVIFLPWQEDRCTLTVLSNTADLFLTGPLSGCNVYLATRPGSPPMVFHGNANANSSSVSLNNQAKDTEAAAIAGEKGYTITHRLARGQYELPAFIWGYRFDTTWAMFVHEFNVSTRAQSNKSLPTK
jgi:hypothetical protein